MVWLIGLVLNESLRKSIRLLYLKLLGLNIWDIGITDNVGVGL